MKRNILIATALLAALAASKAAIGADAPPYPNTSGIGSVPKDEDWYRQCLRVEKVAPPAKDMPAAPSAAALKDCDAGNLYYDTRQQAGAGQADWQRVRHCAFAQAEHSVVMMLYANGSGVARNPELALKYACSLDGAGAEMRLRVEHLLALGKGGKAGTFDLCDDITSGYMQGVCATISERQSAKVRGKQMDVATKGWPAQHKAALEQLQLALNNFAGARGDRETDVSGTARAAMVTEATAAEARRFAQDLRDFDSGKTPQHTEAQFAAADQQLNAAYQKIMKLPATKDGGITSYTTVTKDEVKQTQRAWLKYRDALVSFGALRYPAVPASAWKGLLTQRRAKQLSELASE